MFCLGICGHGDRLTKLFGSHKPCYDGANDRWPAIILGTENNDVFF